MNKIKMTGMMYFLSSMILYITAYMAEKQGETKFALIYLGLATLMLGVALIYIFKRGNDNNNSKKNTKKKKRK